MVFIICKLCKNNVDSLAKSHIVPKFVMRNINKKLKSTNKFLLSTSKERAQDSYKVKLLCQSCEGLFENKGEGNFSKEVFLKYLNNNQREFAYESWMNFFIASVSWRILTVYEKELLEKNLIGEKLREVQNVQEALEPFLLDKKQAKKHPFYIQHHLFNLNTSIFADISDYYPTSFIKGSSISRVIHTDECFYIFCSIAGLVLLTIVRKCKDDIFEGSIISHNKGSINLLNHGTVKSNIIYSVLKSEIVYAQSRTDYKAYYKREEIAKELFELHSYKDWAVLGYLEIDKMIRYSYYNSYRKYI